MRWREIAQETKKTLRDVFLLVSLLIVATIGDPAIAKAALDQDFLSDNTAPFLGPSECEPPKAGASTLTIENKIAQTFIVGFDPGATEAIAAATEKYKLGGVFPVGGSDNSKLTKEFFDGLTTKAGAKVFIGSDDEGGQVARFTENITPSAEEMGKLTPAEAKAKGEEVGKILVAAGLNGDLAPVIDIARPGTPWTATQRDWSSNPDVVISNAGGFAEGLKSAGITPVYKHFPGIGAVTQNTDYQKTDPQKLADLEANGDLKPYQALANKNGGAIMLSNGYVDKWGDGKIPVGINPDAVTYLRNEIKFTGTIMTDALNALSQDGYGSDKMDLSSAIVAALKAGVDMPLFIPSDMDADIDAAIKKVATDVPEVRIQQAYEKSLALRGLPASGATTTATAGAVTCCPAGGTSSGTANLTGNGNLEKILAYLMGKGLTLAQATGVTGNFQIESFEDILPNAQEGLRKGGEGSSKWPAGGFGIAQWTGGRRTGGEPNLVDALTKAGVADLYVDGMPILSDADNDRLLAAELDFFWLEEETTEAASLTALKAITGNTEADAREAARTFERVHERCSPSNGEDGCDVPKRMDYASAAFTKYNDAAPLGGSTPAPATPAAPASAAPAATAPTGGQGQTVVAIDPGHGATLEKYADTVTKLEDRETNNDEPIGTGETTDVLDVSNQVKTQLEAAGYKVVLLRTDSSTPVSKRTRVDQAASEKAAIGISIHTDATGGLNQVWSQKVGSFRENINAGHERVEFKNENTAKLSQQYADAFKTAREAAEGREVSRDPDSSSQAGSFSKERDGLFSWGNTPLIMLWSESIPWVYNEIARDNGRALSPDLKAKYVTGIVNGVKAAIPATGTGSASTDCTGATTTVSGDFQAKVLDYVLPDYHEANYTGSSNAKPEYVAAADKAISEGRYVGNGSSPWYADCGGFVTTLIVDSGHDPGYNAAATGGGGPTETQYAWLEKNWQLLGRAEEIDTATLQPGDVWITRGRGHTFVYIGDVPGINSKAASASNMQRVPMAASEDLNSAGNWYRKK